MKYLCICLTFFTIMSLGSAGFAQADTTTTKTAKIHRLESDVYFVINQLQAQNRNCELSKQSILNACTSQLNNNNDGLSLVQKQLGIVQDELGSTKVLLGNAQYDNLQLKKDLAKARRMNTLEKALYVMGGVVATYFTIKLTK
jgi:hypothetical protein